MIWMDLRAFNSCSAFALAWDENLIQLQNNDQNKCKINLLDEGKADACKSREKFKAINGRSQPCICNFVTAIN